MLKLKLLLINLFFIFVAEAQLADKAENISPLLIGEVVPNTSVVNAVGKTTETNLIFQQKPTVAIFYRGGWCPY